jgi:type II secretory pathway component PulF
MKIDSRTISLFADGMATCLSAGLPPTRALELNRFEKQSKALGKLVRVAQQRCEQGMPLSEALEPSRKFLPHYFLPVLRAGEAGGRLVEAFQLLGRHSRRIGPSVRLVRNTWLYPVILVSFGWAVRIGFFLYFGKTAYAAQFFLSSFGVSALLVLTGWLLLKRREVKDAVDSLLLQIPVVREAELGLSKVLFFSAFRLAYEAGGLGVVPMFNLAFETVRNSAVRQDLLKARGVLDEHGNFADAFGQLTLLEDRFKGMIATGSVSGRLDETLAKLVALESQDLEFRLQAFNNVFQRIVAFCVAMSIVETITICTMF